MINQQYFQQQQKRREKENKPMCLLVCSIVVSRFTFDKSPKQNLSEPEFGSVKPSTMKL